MSKEIPEYYYKFRIVDACESLHMSKMGSSDPLSLEDENELIEFLLMRLRLWGTCKCEYDMAIFNLIKETLKEYPEEKALDITTPESYGKVFAGHFFNTMKDPTMQGPTFTWEKMPERVAMLAGANYYTTKALGQATVHDIDRASEAARIELKRILLDSEPPLI